MSLPTSAAAAQNSVRKVNTAVVLDVLRQRAPISRAEVAACTGLNRSTISSIVGSLLGEGLVQETTLQADRIGRPGMLLTLNPAGGFAVGMEIGVDFLSVVMTDFVANVLWRQRVASDPDAGQSAILERAFGLTQAACDEGRDRRLRPLGIGVGVPGLVELHQGVVRLAPNLGWKNAPLRQMWAERFGLPVFVENDGNAAALGEYYFGVARGINALVYVNADVGLGAGILVGGKLFRGHHGYAAEIGHVTVDPSGELCGCGKRGCLETLAGPRAAVRRVRQAVNNGWVSPWLPASVSESGGVTFDRVVEAARHGDAIAVAALQEVGAHLGAAIANLVNLFNPQMVVLGGALNSASDLLLPKIRDAVAAHVLEVAREGLQIVASAHGAEACVMGAVALVLDDILREPAFG
jgi:glucokinase-like ROK family protein